MWIALGWGTVVGMAVLTRAPAVVAHERVRTLRRESGGNRTRSWASRSSRRVPVVDVVVRVARDIRHRIDVRRRNRVLTAQVPVAIDLLGVAVSAGYPPAAAVAVVARFAPGDIAAEFARVIDSVAIGASFATAVARLGGAGTELGALGRALADAAELGTPVGPVLDRLGVEVRAGLRRRAEAHARTVPVKLLFPLVFLVLPAFGLITVVPAVVSGLRGG